MKTFFFIIIGKVWVGATLEKSKYRLLRFFGGKFRVVLWISIYRRNLQCSIKVASKFMVII